MAGESLDVLTICGSLRKGSYNAMVQRALPGLAPASMTLEPGDILVTGTPSGVGCWRKPPIWMKHGDTCEIEIERIGVLSNPIQDEKR